MTIVEAIAKVMRDRGRPMTTTEVFDAIMDAGLYTFHADDPAHIVRSQIRRHCKDLSFPSASSTKHFTMLRDGTYFVLPRSLKQPTQKRGDSGRRRRDRSNNLRQMHTQYVEQFRRRLWEEIQKIDPTSFELFSKRLLDAYGFRDVQVTQKSRDGGIDGVGELKVGLTYFSVAFQCKRWCAKRVGRREVNQFRGDIQGRFMQGIFFTTGKFTGEAEANKFNPGAVPIVLVDGLTMVDLMIEKRFGVEVEYLRVYSYALDMVIGEETPTVTA